MPHEEKRRHVILDAIRQSDILSELLDKTDGHYKYELELEIIVYGRSYPGGKIGPYARLLYYEPDKVIINKGQWGENTFYVVIEGRVEVHLDGDPQGENFTEVLSQRPFGVNSFLSGEPRYATVSTPRDVGATVLEIRRPAFRLLYQLEEFRRHIGDEYRRHARTNTLKEVTDTVADTCEKPMDEKLRREMERTARFAVYASGHNLFEKDEPIDKLIFIRNGWVKRVIQSPRAAHEPASGPEAAGPPEESADKDKEDFLGEGNWLGLETVCKQSQLKWTYSAKVVGSTEVLELDIEHVRSNPALLKMISDNFPKSSKADDEPPELPKDHPLVEAAGKVIEDGVIDGTDLLVMDMDKCVHCGNCSKACHEVHGYSRLVRRSRIFIKRPEKIVSMSGTQKVSSTQIFVPQVCMHCRDAECLSGCPTGAIDRPKGFVDIDADTCIGCGDCAAQCPYDAISMIPRPPEKETTPPSRRNPLKGWFSLTSPEGPERVTETGKMLAAKCNLCADTPLNPDEKKERAYSCEENCPTGALVRVKPLEYFDEVNKSLGLVPQKRTQPLGQTRGRNIHVKDVPARYIHLIGALTTASVTAAALWCVYRYTHDGQLWGTFLTMRWLTGFVGFIGVLASMAYLWRKKIYRRRRGPLRYWMLAHVYLGLTTGIVLLAHAGRSTGGLLTTALAITFDVAVATGLFGIVCYRFVPRLMTKLEGNPPLLEDLLSRRKELRKRLCQFDTTSTKMRRDIGDMMHRRFFTVSYLFREYWRHEELSKLREDARDKFEADAKALEVDDARALKEAQAKALKEADLDALKKPEVVSNLQVAVKAAVTLRRVDALIYLHRLLKIWVAPHVISVSLMLALMVAHIIQVFLFTVR